MDNNQEKTNSKNTYILFFSNFNETKAEKERLTKLCDKYDAVYLIIKEENKEEHQEFLLLSQKIKIYTGNAWTLIFNRRIEEGWYLNSHEKNY